MGGKLTADDAPAILAEFLPVVEEARNADGLTIGSADLTRIVGCLAACHATITDLRRTVDRLTGLP